MENITEERLENLKQEQKETKKEFKVIEKYVKQEIKSVKARIEEMEALLNTYYQLEETMESVLDEAQALNEGTKIEAKDYKIDFKKGKSVKEDLELVKGRYLIKVNLTEVDERSRITLEFKKKAPRSWKETIWFRGQSGEELLEINYTGRYYLSVDSLGSYEVEVIKKD